MPVMTEAPGEKKARYKMRLLRDEFLSEFDNWNPAGSVIIVDEDTAVRWLENGIAVQAGRDEQTLKEIRRAELLASLEAVEDDEDLPPVVARRPRPGQRPVSPVRPPLKQPTRRGRPAVAPALVGGGVLNSLDDVPEDASDADEDDE